MSTAITIENRLQEYLTGPRPHHALIFSGPAPDRKKKAARTLAAALMQSLSPGQKLGPGVSDRIARDLHPDVLWVSEPEEDTIKIDRIREICHQMEIAPLEAPGKICIIEDCHRMNAAAANAFLKTLEEPLPNRFFWLMTSQVGSLLPTLISRCLVFVFPPNQEAELFNVTAETLKRFERAWQSGDMEAFAQSFEEKSQALEFIHYLQQNLRNTTLATVSGKNKPSLFADSNPYENLRRFDGLSQLESQLRSNANFGLLIESFLTRLRSPDKRV